MESESSYLHDFITQTKPTYATEMAKTLFHINTVSNTVSCARHRKLLIHQRIALLNFHFFFGLECLGVISRVFDLARRGSFSTLHKSLRGVYHVSFQQVLFTLRGVRGLRGGNSNFIFSFYIYIATNVSRHSSC